MARISVDSKEQATWGAHFILAGAEVILVGVRSFRPARIMEIWRPLLKAWLKSNLVWNSDTNGNHESTAKGMKITSPITYS